VHNFYFFAQNDQFSLNIGLDIGEISSVAEDCYLIFC